MVKERCNSRPVAAPGFDDGRVVSAPFITELIEPDGCFVRSDGAINGLQVSRHRLAQLLTNIIQAVAHHVHRAKLYGSVGVHRLNGLREAFKAIYAGDDDVLHAPVLEFGDHLQPEPGILGLGNPGLAPFE